MLNYRSLLAILFIALFYGNQLSFAQTSDTLLAVAAREGDLETVERLLAEGYDPDVSLDEWTPLMLAAMNQELEIARALIEAGANVNALSTEYGSALAVAAMTPLYSEENETAIARLLVESGTDVDGTNGSSMTPLMFAAREGKKETVLFLIEAGADVNWQDVRGWSPLKFAVQSGLPDLVSIMLEAGADPNVMEEYPFRTPLHDAVRLGIPEVVSLLLDAGSEPNGLYDGGETLPPIFSAITEERASILGLLLDAGANPNYPDDGYLDESEDEYKIRTPLDWARKLNSVEMEQMLLKAGAMLQSELDDALVEMYGAILDGDSQTFADVMERGVDPRIPAPTVEGNVALLEVAAARCRADIVGIILDNWEINQYRLETAYQASHCPEEEGVLDVLIEKRPGAMLFTAIATDDPDLLQVILSLTEGTASYRDSKGLTVLYAAAEAGNPEMVRMLLEAGAEITDMSGWGETAIFGAIRQGYTEIVSMFLEAEPALVEMLNRSDMTPLNAAARSGELESLRLLIEAGADIEYTDQWGWTPLHNAAWMGNADCVKLLLEAGADREAHVPTGESALELADIAGNPEVVAILKR